MTRSIEQAPYPNPATMHDRGDRAVVELADEILALRPPEYERYNHWIVASRTDPRTLQAALRETSFNDMVLPEGFSLIWPPHLQGHSFNGRRVTRLNEPGNTFVIGDGQMLPIQIRAGGSKYVHEDTDLYGPDYWLRSLRLRLLYQSGEYTGGQEFIIAGDSRTSDRGGPFRVIRNIISPVFVKGPRDGRVQHDIHSSVHRGHFRQDELVALTGLYRQAFEARVTA